MQAEFSVRHGWTVDKRTPTRWLLSHLRRHWPFFIMIVLGALGNAYGAASVPLNLGVAFNAINQATPDMGAVGGAALAIVISQIIRGVLQFMRNFSSDIVGLRLERDMRDELYASLIGRPMSFHDSRSIGDLMARTTNDVRELNTFMSPGVNIVVGSSSFVVWALLSAPGIHAMLVWPPLVFTVLYGWLVLRYLRQLRPITDAARGAFGALNTVLAESIEGIETVKGFAQETRERTRFAARLLAWRNAILAQGRLEAQFLPRLLLGGTLASGLLLSFYLYSIGEISIGSVIGYNGLLAQLQFPTFASQFAYPAVANGFASARRMWQLLQTGPAATLPVVAPAPVVPATPPMRGKVEFRAVSFGYSETGHAVRDVSFVIQPGQRVAIVGATGSGKSTLIKLLNHTYQPGQGQVLIDDRDVQGWGLGDLRRQISVIEQDIFLFSRSIADNIAYGVPGATQAQIEAAASAAQAHAFITGFKDGYATMVGERGVTLSGGQRQRIAIARALLTDPRILVLDDATSAIDSATEDEIQQAMDRAAAGRTTFLITHRLSQIRWADVIIVMRGGRIEAVGDHAEASRQSEMYRRIFAS